MPNIKLLDTTLRDGMYVTDFVTNDSIKRPTIEALERAGVEIIECGFLGAKSTVANSAKYASSADFAKYISPKKPDVLYVAIAMSLTDIDIANFPARSTETLDGIRIAFFKKDLNAAIALGRDVKNLGYEIIMQPMRTTDYSEAEVENLIAEVNALAPYAVAIVDSTGNMTPKVAVALLHQYESKLAKNIRIGFHFHNNYQLAFANAMTVLDEAQSERAYILDASIFGMGRGAGNLPLELIMNYLNQQYNRNYSTTIIFEIFNRHYKQIFVDKPWGYALKYLIAAMNDVNVYYAGYLADKYGLDDLKIERIIKQIPKENKANVNFKLADILVDQGTQIIAI
jgi:4-hydroxy 2-oxovalerate aldolase